MTAHRGTIRGRRPRLAFTLVEMMVAMAVLLLLASLLFSMISQTSLIWRRTQGKIGTFQEARAGFSTITQTLSQATLNAYWGYDNESAPTRYIRKSELHFRAGQAASLIPSGTAAANPGHAIFFQAPLGYAQSMSGFDTLLNACGFYIQFGSDTTFRPPFITAPERHRYRLMQFIPPTERLYVYKATTGDAWFRDLIASGAGVRPLADNIVFIAFQPRKSTAEIASSSDVLSPSYIYDSRQEAPAGTFAGPWYQLLPPLVDITMVAIDEASAVRLASGTAAPLTGGASPPIDPAWFTTSADSLKDLDNLRGTLAARRINYRVFTSTVQIRGAKWSSP